MPSLGTSSSTMQYTTPVSISRGLAVLSSTHSIVASANGNVLQLHDVSSNSLIVSMPTAGPLTHLVWSTKGPPVLAAVSSPKGNIVIVSGSGKVIADIHGGQLEVSWVVVSSLGRLVVGYEHSIGVAIFNFVEDKLSTFIPFACRVSAKGVLVPRVVSSCDLFAALIIRSTQWQDTLSIVSLSDGRIVCSIPNPAGISRIAGLRWLGDAILVWGRHGDQVEDDSIALLSIKGDVLSDKDIQDADPVIIRTTCGDDATMLVGLGCQESKIRIFDAVCWRLIRDLHHKSPETFVTAPPAIFRERLKRDKNNRRAITSTFDIVECDTAVEIGRAKRADGTVGSDDRDGKGVLLCEFSRDCKYIASRDESARHVVMIWDVHSVRLIVVLILSAEVLTLKWSNHDSRLALGCGGAWVYLWDQSGVAAVRVGLEHEWPPKFEVRKLSWAHNDTALMLVDGSRASAFRTVFVK